MTEGEDGVKHGFHPQWCQQVLLGMVFFFNCADKLGQAGHKRPTSSHSFTLCISTLPICVTSHFQTPLSLSFFSLLLPPVLHAFTFPSAPLLHPSLHPSAHCVITLLCGSEHFV